MTVKYGNGPKSEIRKKKKKKRYALQRRERILEGGEGIFKKKNVSRQRKTKGLLNPETRHLLVWQLPAARRTPPAKPNF